MRSRHQLVDLAAAVVFADSDDSTENRLSNDRLHNGTTIHPDIERFADVLAGDLGEDSCRCVRQNNDNDRLVSGCLNIGLDLLDLKREWFRHRERTPRQKKKSDSEKAREPGDPALRYSAAWASASPLSCFSVMRAFLPRSPRR